ncbi:hypothetical protein E3N88_16671 [Mikania micrantha]|uniref:EF-hand domain-containing protein n=1 Tax=Mikania micrantha TaxID=192012 RepID=A0A5N6P0R7_9ASTR|nr:hypothetical protein E3N88_16671 [Mikania micrantha]
MEELRRIAMASYQASSSRLRNLGHDFFASMDHDGNGKIDQREFLEFMKEAGHVKMSNMFFFNQLDLNEDGHLDFDEVMMVYYIIQSGRPFCDRCNRFVTSTYLTCVTCLEDPTACPYYLCLDCYAHARLDHLHDNSSQFVDNYSLLEYLTKSKLCELRSRPNAPLAIQGSPNSGYNQPHPVQTRPWKTALDLLNIGVYAGFMSTTFCTIL